MKKSTIIIIVIGVFALLAAAGVYFYIDMQAAKRAEEHQKWSARKFEEETKRLNAIDKNMNDVRKNSKEVRKQFGDILKANGL